MATVFTVSVVQDAHNRPLNPTIIKTNNKPKSCLIRLARLLCAATLARLQEAEALPRGLISV